MGGADGAGGAGTKGPSAAFPLGAGGAGFALAALATRAAQDMPPLGATGSGVGDGVPAQAAKARNGRDVRRVLAAPCCCSH
jgi:hypothetical protein